MIASERGIEVSEQRFAGSQHYTNLVRVAMETEDGDVDVSGTTMGPEQRLFLAGALGFAIDIELAPLMAFLTYDDVPGVICRVGTMFGEAGVNIANMAVSRTKEGGKALMAFSIDSPAPPELGAQPAAEFVGRICSWRGLIRGADLVRVRPGEPDKARPTSGPPWRA